MAQPEEDHLNIKIVSILEHESIISIYKQIMNELSVADSSDGRAGDCGSKGPRFKPR